MQHRLGAVGMSEQHGGLAIYAAGRLFADGQHTCGPAETLSR